MILYSAWSALLVIALLSICSWQILHAPGSPHEWLYFLVVALFHGIFAIWFAKGRGLIQFKAATLIGRLLTAGMAACVVVFRPALANDPELSTLFWFYALLTLFVDVASALWMLRTEPAVMVFICTFVQACKRDLTASTKTPALSFEGKNRIAFGFYLLGLGLWQLMDPNSLLNLLHMPATGFDGGGTFAFGPMHLLGMQIIVLAAYNLIAGKYDLTPLITAGMHGGMVTIVTFILLVGLGCIHPINLLLPAVDLVSVSATFIHRLRRSKKP